MNFGDFAIFFTLNKVIYFANLNTMSKKKTYKVWRDAKTGQFITVKAAKRRPNTTVVVTMKRKK